MTQAPTGEIRLQFTYLLQRDETIGKAEEESAKMPSAQAGLKDPNLLAVNIVRAKGLKLSSDVET